MSDKPECHWCEKEIEPGSDTFGINSYTLCSEYCEEMYYSMLMQEDDECPKTRSVNK